MASDFSVIPNMFKLIAGVALLSLLVGKVIGLSGEGYIFLFVSLFWLILIGSALTTTEVDSYKPRWHSELKPPGLVRTGFLRIRQWRYQLIFGLMASFLLSGYSFYHGSSVVAEAPSPVQPQVQELAGADELARQREQAQAEELARQKYRVQAEELARQQELARAAELAKPKELAKPQELANAQELAKVQELTRSLEQARELARALEHARSDAQDLIKALDQASAKAKTEAQARAGRPTRLAAVEPAS